MPGNIDYSEITNDDGNVVMVDVLDEDGNTRFPNSQLFLVSESGAKAKVMEMDADGRLKPHAVNKGDIQRIGTLTLDEYKETVKDAEKPMPKEESASNLEETVTNGNQTEQTKQEDAANYTVASSLQGKIGSSLSKGEADSLVSEMESRPEKARNLPLTPENWKSEFGENGEVNTPLGVAKMGENQLAKMFMKGREAELGLVKPTLENPDVIIEEGSKAKNGESERPSSYLFVKVFDRDGKKIKFYASVSVKKDGLEVIVSNHFINKNSVDRKLQEGKVLYIRGKSLSNSSDKHLAEHPSGGSDLLPTPESDTPSESKDTNNSTNDNGNNATLTFEDGSAVPLLEDGNPDFSQMSAQQSAELYDNTLGEDASQVIGDNVAAAKKALDKANGMKVKGNSFLEQKASKEAKERAIKEAQEKYDSAKAISEAYEERQLNKNLETHDGRMSLLDKAKAKYARLKGNEEWKEKANELWNETVGKALHRLYDGLSVNVFDTEPQTIEEYVSGSLVPFSLNYEGNENGKGVKQETGLERKDFAKSRVLAAEGKGKTMDKLVHELWENRPSQFESYTDQDIRDAVIGLITSDMNAYDMRHVIENNRIAQAEKEIEDEKIGHENAQYQEEQQLAEQEQQSAERQDEGNSENASLPFGEQLDESAVPFSVNGERTGKEYDINDADDRKRLIAENSVEDKDILEIDMPKHVHNAIKAIAKKMGLKVQFLYMGSSANGWIENGTIYLCLDAERAMQFVFGHEMTHAIKQANPSAYRELVKVAASIMTDEEWDKQVAANLAKYRGMAGYNTADDIVEEVVADALGKFMDDFDLAKRFALKLSHPVLASVIQAIRDIKNLVLGAPYRQLESLEKIVENAYVDAARGTLEASTSGNRMSLKNKEEVKEANDRFNSEIEGFKNKTHKGLMHLGKPSPILKACGVDVDEITLSPKVLNRKLNQHSLSTDDVKDLVNAIQKPIMVYQHGKTRPNIVVITDTEIRGNKLSVALELDEDGNVTELNNVSSVHDKNADKEIERWLSWDEGYFENALRWVDKEKVSDWLSSARLISYSQTENNQKLSSLANVLNSFENPKISEENLQKSEEKASAIPETLEDFLASPKLKFSIKTEAERKAAQNAYDYAMSLRPNKWKQYALVNMMVPNQAPTYYEKNEFADKWRVYANRIWKDNTDFKLFDLDKPFEEQVMNVKGKVPTEFEPQKSKEKEGIAHRQKLRREMDIADATIDRLNRKSREDFNDFIEKYAAEHGLANKYDVPYEVWQEAQHDISDKYDAQKDALLEKLNSLKEEMQNVAAKFSLQDGKTLVGVHNISEDKLRKAIKQGGLANPSVAVIDMSKQAHEGYGEISLIMPSAKIAKKTGRNAGTWQGDAWTPTYPQVERQMDSKGSEKASEDVMSVPREMQGRVRMGMNAWLDNGNDTSGMAYLFLHERSKAPEMKTTPSKYSEDTYNELRHITAGDFNLFGIGKADTEKVIDLYVKEKYGGDRAAYEDGLRNWVEKNKKAAAEDKNGLRKAIAIQNLDIYGEHGFNFKGVQSFVRDVEYDHRKGGKADIDGAMRASDEYVKSQGLQDEFNKWLEGKEKQYGIKEVIFDGFTPSGKRRYVDNTLENVSKLMKRQGRNGSSGLGFSFNNFAAKLMNSYGKLSDIRSKKNLLTSSHEDLDKFREKWGEVFFELGKKCQPDAENPFDDYGMERLSEAALQKDPQAYLKKEYNVDFSDADLEKLNDMIKAIKEEYPAMYFETKFERPVGLEEFKAAVVPSTLANGVKESLQEAGLPLYEYDRTKEGDRRRAFEDAIGASDDVRFSINTYHGSAAGFDRFDHSHMGEGEGAQAYGWGTYVTEVEGIGRTYAKQSHNRAERERFKNTTPFDDAIDEIISQERYSESKDFEAWKSAAIKELKSRIADNKINLNDFINRNISPEILELWDDAEIEEEIATIRKRIKDLENEIESIQTLTEERYNKEVMKQGRMRHLYTVEIPDDTGENYLEWDKEYTQKQTDNLLEKLFDAAKDNDEQTEAVQEFSNWLLDDEVRSKDFYQNTDGRAIYNKLAECLGGSDRKASELLHKAGFTGIKYPADFMRGGREDGKKNYVIFNEGDAKIVEHTRFSLKTKPERNMKTAVSALKKIAAGEEYVPNAVVREDLEQYGGDKHVGFYWGKTGNPDKKFKGGYGLAHIGAKHGEEVIRQILDVLCNGKIDRYVDGNKTVILSNGKFECVLALTKNGNKETWLLSGWDKIEKAGENSEVSTQSVPMQGSPTFSRTDLGAALSAAKLDKTSESSKKNAEKFSLRRQQIHSKEFKKWFGDWEKAPESASKVVDENGEPLVVYHGTTNDEGKRTWNSRTKTYDTSHEPFTVFRREVDGLPNGGLFFNSDKDNAYGYGYNTYAVYLNIKHPLTIDCKGALYNAVRHDGKEMDTYDWANWAEEKGYDGVIFKNIKDGVDYGAMQETTDDYVVFNSNQIKSADSNNGGFSAKNNDIRFSLSDSERLSPEIGNKPVNIVEGKKEHGFRNFSEAKEWAKANIVRTYSNEETGGKGIVNISNTAIGKFLSESAIKKTKDKDVHLCVLRVLPDVLRESVDAVQHEDRKKVNGSRSKANGINPDVMIHRCYGAVNIGEKNYGVKITLKENVKTKENTKLYSYEATKIELLDGQNGDVTMTSPRNSNNSISVAKIVNSFENSTKKEEKFSLRDQEYMKAVEDGDMEKAQAMVNEAAKRAGYSAPSDYQGTSAFNGAAPWGNGYFLTREERKEAWDNDEFDGDSSLGDYIKDGIDGGNLEVLTNSASFRSADSMRKKAILNVRNAINSKAKTIKMYRSVPASVKEGSFRNGDWITPSKDYAKDNAALHGWGNDYRIIEQEVPVDDVWFDGNDIAEWGYGREEDYANDTDFAYKNTENNKKLLEPVTYDDEGKVIPLSKRFDEKKSDVRFSLMDAKEDRIQKLRESKPIEITGKEITPSDDLKQYKKNALEYGKTLRGKYINEDTGEEIDLTGGNKRGGIREILQHDYKDIEHLQSIAAIPQIIEKSVFIDELPNEDKQNYPDVKNFRYYVCGLRIGGKDYTVKAVVAEQNNGNRYYDHRLTNIEKGKLLSIIPTIQKAGIDGNMPNSWDKDKRLISILQVKSENSSSNGAKFSLRYDDYEKQLEQWKKDNGLPKDAQRPTLPIRNAGESATDYMARVQQYRKEMALWKTAPTYETHLLDSDKAQGIYNRELQRGSVLRRIAMQDSMLAIRKAQEAIMREHGAAINMAEDAYTAENRSHGKGNAHYMYHPNDNVGIFPYAIRENP